MANHIVSLYSTPELDKNKNDGEQEEYNIDEPTNDLIKTNTVTRSFLAKYISYARRHISPTINNNIKNLFVLEYNKMRSMGVNKKTITATPR